LAGAGTLHVAQLLLDLIHLHKQRWQALWLASFDVERCYHSITWWAIFGLLNWVGVPEGVDAMVCKFLSVPSHRFRFGQVDREPWRTANGLLQDCPASPDPLNLLLEYFHHWGVAAGPGAVAAPDYHVASVRFAEDVDLVAKDQAVLEALIGANLQWCALLGVSVSKCRSGQICRADWWCGLLAWKQRRRPSGFWRCVGRQ
jgi:hypothetical protein